MEKKILFLVFCPQGLGQLAGLKADFGRVKQLVWEYGFCPASTDFPPARKGLGGNAGGILIFLRE
jgi:hypothetical protein